MEKRLAAYMFFLIAGMAVASLAILLLGRPQVLLEMYRHPQEVFWFVVLPGVAAVLAAGLVQRPFLRAVRARRRLRAYVWVLAGVLAAHAAYALLVFCAGLLLRIVRQPVVDSLSGREISLDWSLDWVLLAARLQLQDALAMGVVSLMFGLLPNLLIGGGFAWYMLHRQPAAQPAVQSSAGAGHAE